MEEKELIPEGTSRSAMPKNKGYPLFLRASVVTHWVGYFSPPEAGFLCPLDVVARRLWCASTTAPHAPSQ